MGRRAPATGTIPHWRSLTVDALLALAPSHIFARPLSWLEKAPTPTTFTPDHPLVATQGSDVVCGVGSELELAIRIRESRPPLEHGSTRGGGPIRSVPCVTP